MSKQIRSQASIFHKLLLRQLTDNEAGFIVAIWKSEIGGTPLRHLDKVERR